MKGRRWALSLLATLADSVMPLLGRRSIGAILLAAGWTSHSDRVAARLLREAQRRLHSGSAERARDLLRAMSSRPPTRIDLCRRLAELLRETGDRRGAEATALLLAARARDREDAGNVESAIKAYEASLVADPTAREVHFRLGSAKERARDWHGAAEAYEAAVGAGGAPAEWFFRLGRARERSKDRDGAIDAYERAVARDDDPPSYWHYRLGFVNEMTGAWDRAINAYHRSLQQGGDPLLAYYRIGRAREEKRKREASSVDDRIWDLDRMLPDGSVGLVAPIWKGRVRGWILAHEVSHSDTVALELNGRTIALARPATETIAVNGTRYLEFYRNISGVRRYAGAGDRLVVTYRGARLPIAGSGHEYEFSGARREALSSLERRIDDGYVFDKRGHLGPSLVVRDEWQEAALDLFFALRSDLKDEFDLAVLPSYGTLLGAVRDGDFIAHDTDFDAMYVSKHPEREEVVSQALEVYRYLVDRDYSLVFRKTCVWVMGGAESRVDLHHAWFDRSGRFQISFGYRGEAVEDERALLEPRTVTVAGRRVPVPGNAESVLEQIYGPGWRVPDPGFRHEASPKRTIDRDFFVPVESAASLYWYQFYREPFETEPSSYARSVTGTLSDASAVVDIGCGNGRDTLHFAESGLDAWGVDAEPRAIEAARSLARAQGTAPRFAVLDVSEDGALDVIKEGIGQYPAFYLRFFVHAVPSSVVTKLIDWMTEHFPGRHILCAEFRTLEDEQRRKEFPAPYRRFVDAPRFVSDALTSRGYVVASRNDGVGLAPFRSEDPHVARITATHGTSRPG